MSRTRRSDGFGEYVPARQDTDMGAEPESESYDGNVARAWEWLQTILAGRQVPALVVVVGLGDGNCSRRSTGMHRDAPCWRWSPMRSAQQRFAGTTGQPGGGPAD